MWTPSHFSIGSSVTTKRPLLPPLLHSHTLIDFFFFLLIFDRICDGESERSGVGSEEDVSGGLFDAEIWAVEWPCFRVDWWLSPMGRACKIFSFPLFFVFVCFRRFAFLLRLFWWRIASQCGIVYRYIYCLLTNTYTCALGYSSLAYDGELSLSLGFVWCLVSSRCLDRDKIWVEAELDLFSWLLFDSVSPDPWLCFNVIWIKYLSGLKSFDKQWVCRKLDF